MKVAVGIFAHNEERTIERAISRLLAEALPLEIHVLANGCTDGTVARAVRALAGVPNAKVHDIPVGDKANAWNLFVHSFATAADLFVFTDGDCAIVAGSLRCLTRALESHPEAVAFAALPISGRRQTRHNPEALSTRQLQGNLYALRGSFVAKIRARGFRLPIGIVGEDSLVGGIAKFNLEDDGKWEPSRVYVCEDAGFEFDSLSLTSPADILTYWRRLKRYARRTLELQMLVAHWRKHGFRDYPRDVYDLYSRYLRDVERYRTSSLLLVEWMARHEMRKKLRRN